MKFIIKEIMKERKVTQSDLAERIGVCRTHLCELLQKDSMSTATLESIAKALGVRVRDTFVEDEEYADSESMFIKLTSIDTSPENVASVLKRYFISAGLSPEKVAEIVGVKEETVRRYFTPGAIRINKLYKVCDKLNIDIRELLVQSVREERSKSKW